MEAAAPFLEPNGGGPFASVFQCAAIGMALVDGAGSMMAVNPALVELLGYREDELIGHRCDVARHRSDVSPLPERFAELSQGKRSHFTLETRCRHKDGRTVWGRLTVSALDPTYFVGMLEDITDHKRAERRHAIRLAVTQQLAEAPSADAALDAIFEAMCRSLEWDYGELWMLEPDADRLAYQMGWYGSPELRSFAEASREIPFSRGSGLPGRVWAERRPVWVGDVHQDPTFLRHESAKALGLRGAIAFPIVSGAEFLGVMAFFSRNFEEPDPDLLNMMSDIGSQIDQFLMRRRAEEKLQQLGAVLASTDDAVPTMTPDGIINDANQAFETLFGYSPEELKGQPISILVPPDRQAESRALLRKAQEGERIEHFETVRRAKDGRLIDVSLSIAPVRDPEGSVCCITEVIRDITARKQAERYKDEFLSVLSHELKTPLNFIMGFASILLDDAALNPDQRSCVAHIIEGSDRLYMMIQNLLCLSDILAERFHIVPEYTPLDVLVNEAIQPLRLIAEKKGVLIETVGSTREVYVDGNKIIQLMAILIENAIKFTPGGGSIQIEAQVDEEELTLRVRDTGIGIGASDQERIFTRLQQLDMTSTRKAGGIGVGLSIGKAIAEAHAGAIGVESRPGSGSTFWVRLPQPPAERHTTAR